MSKDSLVRPKSLWLWAFRPRTLPLSVSAIVLGLGLAASQARPNWTAFILAVLTALGLQILSNLANDYGDAVAGKDTEARVGPLRVTGSGLISQARMKQALILATLFCLVCGLALVVVGSSSKAELLFFLLLGAGCVIAAIAYTVGKNPYGYRGWGDLLVLIFFGLVAVGGSAILCGAKPGWYLLLPGLGSGLWTVMVLNINNLRDLETDKATGKLSLPVRLGLKRAKIYHLALYTGGLLAWAVFFGLRQPVFIAGLLLTLPLAWSTSQVLRHTLDADCLNLQLKLSVMSIAVANLGLAGLCALL